MLQIKLIYFYKFYGLSVYMAYDTLLLWSHNRLMRCCRALDKNRCNSADTTSCAHCRRLHVVCHTTVLPILATVSVV